MTKGSYSDAFTVGSSDAFYFLQHVKVDAAVEDNELDARLKSDVGTGRRAFSFTSGVAEILEPNTSWEQDLAQSGEKVRNIW